MSRSESLRAADLGEWPGEALRSLALEVFDERLQRYRLVQPRLERQMASSLRDGAREALRLGLLTPTQARHLTRLPRGNQNAVLASKRRWTGRPTNSTSRRKVAAR
jgi:hypothetical protein